MFDRLRQIFSWKIKWYSDYPSSSSFTEEVRIFYDQFNSMEDFVEYAENTLGKEVLDEIRLKPRPTTLLDMYWYFI